MNLNVCAKFGPDRTTGDDVYTVGRIHTHTDTHTLSYIDIDDTEHARSVGLRFANGFSDGIASTAFRVRVSGNQWRQLRTNVTFL